MPAGAVQRVSGVEADVRLAGHERVVAEPLVLGGVRDDHRLVGQDGVPAEGDGPGRLGRGQAAGGLEPLAVGVHQADVGHRDPQDERQEPGDAVEPLLRRRVEQVQGVQLVKAFGVVLGDRCGDHRPLIADCIGIGSRQGVGRCLSSTRQAHPAGPRRRLPLRPVRRPSVGDHGRSLYPQRSPRSGAIGTKGRSADAIRTRRTHRRGTLQATLGPAIPLRSSPPCGRKSSPRRRKQVDRLSSRRSSISSGNCTLSPGPTSQSSVWYTASTAPTAPGRRRCPKPGPESSQSHGIVWHQRYRPSPGL